MDMKTRVRLAKAATLLAAAALTAACETTAEPPIGKATPDSPDAPGAAATWTVDPDQRVSKSATGFTARVSRLGCNNGVTGRVNEPQIQFNATQVVITFTVSPEPELADCPGNDEVPYDVSLGQPLGNRSLVDGACLPDGEARTTSSCDRSATRQVLASQPRAQKTSAPAAPG